jgi:XTP/dITP diphosphohydrolase
MRLLFASTNKAKLVEVTTVAASLGVLVEGLGDFTICSAHKPPPSVSEVGTTYYENARVKAISYATWSGISCIADDSGIEVPSLGNLPGVYTAGFGFARMRDLLVPDFAYEATFRCCMCFADTGGRSVSVEGAIDGFVSFPRGAAAPSSPVPYSHFFTPLGENQTLAELSSLGGYPSHRVKALTSLLSVLNLTDPAVGRE